MGYSQEISAKMLQVIANAKVAAKAAEEEYDRQADRAQALAMEDFRLGDRRNLGRAADIGAACKKACEGLYVAYQDLVRIIDEQCRPLLAQDPEPSAIRAVRDMIRWLNDESEIENNFSASFNGADLGDVICVRFSPNATSKMIQAHWDNVYMMHPGRADFEAEEKQAECSAREKAAAEAREKHRAAVAQREAALEPYKKELERFRERVAQVESLRSAETRRLSEEQAYALREKLLSPILQQMEQTKEKLAQGESTSAELTKKLSTLGFFQLGAKMEINKSLKALHEQQLALQIKLANLREKEQKAKESAAAQVKAMLPQLRKQAQAQYPMPEEPCPPGMTPQDLQRQKIKEAIVETLRKNQWVKLEDLMEKCPALEGMTSQRVNAILRGMVGQEIRINEYKRMRFYEVREEFFSGNDEYRQSRRESILKCVKTHGHVTVAKVCDDTYLDASMAHTMLEELCTEGLLVSYRYENKLWFELF